MNVRTLWLVLLAVAAAASAGAQQRDEVDTPLSTARSLYASARYDEALAVLNGISSAAAAADRRSVEQYRSLCLLALGRGQEAEAAIAAVITADPMFQPGESDASPRVRAAFSDVRQKLLPQIATARYMEAKAAFDRREHADAEARFRGVLVLLDDPQMGGRLPDLRLLAAGFLELSAAAAAPPPPPARVEGPPVPAPPPAPVLEPERVYSAEDAEVKPAVAIRQNVPAVPSTIIAQARRHGVLDVQIDEQGRVTDLIVRISVHPVYDQLLLAAAREWRYRPATRDGQPVKFRKVMQLSVARQ